MTHLEAMAFFEGCVRPATAVWADLGAGSGTFSLALSACLGDSGTVHAVDKDPAVLRIEALPGGAKIIGHERDFGELDDLPMLDGVLMANALHFAPDPEGFLSGALSKVKPDGQFVLIEYDREEANPWIPYPVSLARFVRLCASVGLDAPEVVHRRASRYNDSEMYCAVTRRG